MAKVRVEELASTVVDGASPVAVTVSPVTGRRLPPRPAWWKGDEAATMHNRVAAESLAKASPSRGRK